MCYLCIAYYNKKGYNRFRLITENAVCVQVGNACCSAIVVCGVVYQATRQQCQMCSWILGYVGTLAGSDAQGNVAGALSDVRFTSLRGICSIKNDIYVMNYYLGNLYKHITRLSAIIITSNMALRRLYVWIADSQGSALLYIVAYINKVYILTRLVAVLYSTSHKSQVGIHYSNIRYASIDNPTVGYSVLAEWYTAVHCRYSIYAHVLNDYG